MGAKGQTRVLDHTLHPWAPSCEPKMGAAGRFGGSLVRLGGPLSQQGEQAVLRVRCFSKLQMCIHLSFEWILTKSHLKPSQLSYPHVACHCRIFLLHHKYIWCQHTVPLMSAHIPLSIHHIMLQAVWPLRCAFARMHNLRPWPSVSSRQHAFSHCSCTRLSTANSAQDCKCCKVGVT